MLAATQPAVAPKPLSILLVGDKEEDFFLIRDILSRTRGTLPAELDHAHALDEARMMLRQKRYGLILFQHEMGDAEAVRLLSEFLHEGVTIPFIVLTEDATEQTVAGIIEDKNWNCLAKSQLDGATLIRTMRSTLALHGLKEEKHAAEELLRKLSRAVEQSADTVVITDREGNIEYVNPAFERLTGYCRDEVLGRNPRILKSGEQGREIYEEIWNMIIAGQVYRGILVNRKKNGELYHIEQSISPVRDAEGNITHFIANGRDLTDRVHLEAQLRQAQKMDAIGRLAGGVAHDFNNLLTIITSYSELALDELTATNPVGAKIQEVLLAARRAAELTRQLLAFSRKQPRALRVADLNLVISHISKTLPRLIGEDIEFSFLPGEGLGPVRVDPLQMEQILMNLACNARDAMPDGGCLSIETSDLMLDAPYVHHNKFQIPVGRYVLLTVTDNGDGIPPEHLPHIFEPFFTTKPAGQGTGLGLATVYGIVKQNKGFIWAHSEAGVGAVFKIYLPCVKEKTPPAMPPAPERVLSRGSETLLLVEDETAVRNAAAEFLRIQGYIVHEAHDGAQALAIARECPSPIDLVITDVVMPNLSGEKLAKELLRERPGLKLLFVSGYAGKTVLDDHFFDVEKNFLQKPYTLRQLSAKICDALQSKPAASRPV